MPLKIGDDVNSWKMPSTTSNGAGGTAWANASGIIAKNKMRRVTIEKGLKVCPLEAETVVTAAAAENGMVAVAVASTEKESFSICSATLSTMVIPVWSTVKFDVTFDGAAHVTWFVHTVA
jgi:hypothetical protein